MARHREKQFSMTVRIKKTRIFKNILKSKNSSSEKYFLKISGSKIFEILKIWKFSQIEKSIFHWKLKFFDIFSKISKIFDPEKLKKIGRRIFDFKIFLNILVFSIRTVIKNCFSLCLANPQHLHTFEFTKNN